MKHPILLTLLVTMAGCATASTLPGSAWQLQAIQSMDDAQGTTRIPDPSRFTLAFDRDGHATLRLDCNRASTSYKLEAASDGTSGALSFGPLATTRARCAPPQLDQRIARDLSHVRGYLFKDGKLYLSLLADGGIYEWAPLPAASAAAAQERVVKPLSLGDGNTTFVRDRISGHRYIDYQLSAAAGQTLQLHLGSSNRANYFNLLPPGSLDAAMAIGELNNNHLSVLLPDDGIYTIRVFLQRAAARRDESSRFTLSLALTGKALPPLAASADALVAGTRYHAQGKVTCRPAYTEVRECEAGVIRRGHDGTATVALRWPTATQQTATRRILFIKGRPQAADVPQALSFSRNALGWRITFNQEEYFDIPEALVLGG